MSPYSSSHADVILISMPFGPLRQPSLGLGLLKASTPDIPTRILHLTLPFAERIGVEFYNTIVAGFPLDSALAGDWLFRGALTGGDQGDIDGYLDTVVRDSTRRGRDPEPFIRQLLDATAHVDAFLDDCERAIVDGRPRLVGFTSVFQQTIASLALARRLKAAVPETPIVFGGANCEGEMGLELIRQFPFVDVVVSGEADLVYPELAARLLAGRPPPDAAGIYTQANAARATAGHTTVVRDLDRLPIPDFGEFFAQWDDSPVRHVDPPRIPFETSRGCWWGEKHHCTFCGLNGDTMTFRSKSAGRAIDELERLLERYGRKRVWVVDNILDMRYLKDFVPELARRQLGVEFFYEVKANLRKDQLRAMFEAGITAIQPGIESLSDEVLRLMRKGVSGLQNIQLLKWCAEIGVWPIWHFLWGFPGEPADDYAWMADMLPLLSHLPPPKVGARIRLDRFSPNYFEGERLGLRNIRPHPAYRYIYPVPEPSLSRLAYFFTYDYADGRDPSAYTAALECRIADWQRAFEESDLSVLDRGTALWIWDLREVARRPLTILEEPARSVYLACDGVRSASSLAGVTPAGSRSALSAREVGDLLQTFIDDGLMICRGDHVLGLAVARQETEADAA